jgi:uncharacterized membrane protein
MLRPMLQEREVAVEPAVGVPSIYRDPLTWVIVSVVFGAYTVISVFRLMELNPGSWDLAIFTEMVKQYAHLHAPIVDARGAGTNLLGDHFSPAMAIFAPFFRIFPSSATLLVGQALLTAVSVFPVAQAARERLSPGPARAIALAYGFSWGLQQMINFDVHEIAIAVPLLAFTLSAVVRGRIMTALWWALPLVFVKEDQGFTVAAIGVYLLVSGVHTEEVDRVRVRVGEFLLVWGLAWSVLAITVIIPHFNADHVYTYWNLGGALAPGHHASVPTLLRQFWYAWPVKLETIVLLLLPTAFLAVRSPLALIAVPSLALRFESSNSAYWGTAWHYNATVMPILFIAAIAGLASIRAARQAEEAARPETGDPDEPNGVHGPDEDGGVDRAGGARERAGGAREPDGTDRPGWASGHWGLWRATLAGAERHGAAMMVAIAAAMAFQYPLSGLWNGQTYEISPHVAAADAAMAKVPNGATVITTLDLLASMAARTDAFWIGNPGNPKTEYIVYDGKDSGYPPGTSVPGLIAQFYPGHIYTQVFVDDGVYVFHRNTP